MHFCTGKPVSEALILESVNPQYDKRLFIELQEKYKFRTCCVKILFWTSKQKQKNNFHNVLLPALLAPHIKKLETYFALLYYWTFAQCGAEKHTYGFD